MGHIERETDTFREHLIHTIHHRLGRPRLVLGTPFVEPSAPEFRTHLRGIGAQLSQPFKLLINVGSRTEIHRPRQVVETVLGEVTRPVALEEYQLVTVDGTQTVANLRNVGFILSIGTVLVLHLHHDDGATTLDGQRCQLFSHFLLELFHAFHKEGVTLTKPYVFLLQQPPGQSSHFPCRDRDAR